MGLYPPRGDFSSNKNIIAYCAMCPFRDPEGYYFASFATPRGRPCVRLALLSLQRMASARPKKALEGIRTQVGTPTALLGTRPMRPCGVSRLAVPCPSRTALHDCVANRVVNPAHFSLHVANFADHVVNFFADHVAHGCCPAVAACEEDQSEQFEVSVT